MSVGPSALIGGIAATPFNQAKGTELERAQHDTVARQRQAAGERKAADAAGIGVTEGEDNAAGDRDADGRRLWEKPPDATGPSSASHDSSPPSPPDPTGQNGTLLDLSG